MYSKVKNESNSFSVLEVCLCNLICSDITILPTKTTAAQNDDALSYYIVRGLYFLAIVYMRSITMILQCSKQQSLHQYKQVAI